MDQSPAERRPLTTRSARWAIALAAGLARVGVSPNAISLASVVFAAGACVLFCRSPEITALGWRAAALIVAAVCIQLRLLCNLLDGMVAIEGGRRTATGELFNELPDRVADALILVGAGYAARALPWAIELGWACAVLAVGAAYLRAVGQGLGLPGLFLGPMAKPQRMAAMTVAALGAAAALPWQRAEAVLALGLAVVALGTLVTCARRTRAIARHLERR